MKQLGPEAMAITKTFHSLGVEAKVVARFTTPSFVLYGIQKKPAERIAKIENAVPELALAVSENRGASCRVRLQHPPIMLEVPRRDARSIPWPDTLENGPHEFTIGRGYEWGNAITQIVSLNESAHTLIAGITGSGKSVLEVGAVLSLAIQTSPDECEILPVDLKNDDLIPLQKLPHVTQFATNPDDAVRIIEYVAAESARRRDSGSRNHRRIVVAIDELAQLPADALELLNSILALGRSQRINIISATQHPTAEVMGGSVGKVNYTTRIPGRVADATAAATASGRGKTGAEFLPGKGAFLRIEGAELTRFQAYILMENDVERLVAQCVAKWGPRQAQPVTVQATVVEDAQADEDEQTATLRKLAAEHYDWNRRKWAHGTKAIVLRAVFGDGVPIAGNSGKPYARQLGIMMENLREF